MKKLLFFLLFFPFISKCQTLNYYSTDVPGTWKTITVFIPSGDSTKTKAYYNSSVSKSIEFISEVKDVSKDDFHASIIHIGSDLTNYLLIASKDGKQMVLTDNKQMMRTVFILDSTLFNPPIKQANDYSGVTDLMLKAFKFLIF